MTKKTQTISVDLFKKSGKWKYSMVAEVDVEHRLGSEEYKQDIVNTQRGVFDGWQNHGYIAVTDAIPDENGDYEGFHKAVFSDDDFEDIYKEEFVKHLGLNLKRVHRLAHPGDYIVWVEGGSSVLHKDTIYGPVFDGGMYGLGGLQVSGRGNYQTEINVLVYDNGRTKGNIQVYEVVEEGKA